MLILKKHHWKPLFTTLFIQWSISLLFYLCLWTASAFSGSVYFLRTSLTTVSSETLWYIKLKRWLTHKLKVNATLAVIISIKLVMTDNEVTVIISGHEMMTTEFLSCRQSKSSMAVRPPITMNSLSVVLLWYTCQLMCIMHVTHLQIENVNLMLKGQFHIHYSQIQVKCSVTISNK